VTNESLYEGIKTAVAGNRVGDIGAAIQTHTEIKQHYGVVRELVGHGVGKNMKPQKFRILGKEEKDQCLKKEWSSQ